MKVYILGCGTSSGVPAIGCACNVCSSRNSKNSRTRASVLIEEHGKVYLIDTGPDLRMQLLRAQVSTLNGVFYTHAHADHVHGIDDLRGININTRKAIKVWGSKETLKLIQNRFGYAFDSFCPYLSRPSLIPNIIQAGVKTRIENMEVIAFDQNHGKTTTTGYRFGDVAYSTDVKSFNRGTFEFLKDLKLWIIDCVGYSEHPTHSHLELTLEWIKRVRPEKAILTHMSHQLDYEELLRKLPKNVAPGFDGLIIDIS